jgi:hypothetical protein
MRPSSNLRKAIVVVAAAGDRSGVRTGSPFSATGRQGSSDAVPGPSEPLDKSLTLLIRANGEPGVAESDLRRQVTVARRTGHSWAAIGYVARPYEAGCPTTIRWTCGRGVGVLHPGELNVLGAPGARFLRNMRGHLYVSKRAGSSGRCKVESSLLLGEVEIKLDQISSASLLPAQP